jgi:hypothetical protein
MSTIWCIVTKNPLSDLPSHIDWNRLLTPGTKLFSLPLDVVLKNNIALSYFIDYMSSIGAQAYLFFYLNVEGKQLYYLAYFECCIAFSEFFVFMQILFVWL